MTENPTDKIQPPFSKSLFELFLVEYANAWCSVNVGADKIYIQHLMWQRRSYNQGWRMREGERARIAFSLWAQDIVTSSFAWMRLQTLSDVTTTRLPKFCRNLKPVGQFWEKTDTARCTHSLKKQDCETHEIWWKFSKTREFWRTTIYMYNQRALNRGGPSQSI